MVGGKTYGAGGGGTILLLAREGHIRRIHEVCRALGGELMPFAWTVTV